MSVSSHNLAIYNEAIKAPKDRLVQLDKTCKEIILKSKKMPKIAPYYNLELAMIYSEMISLSIVIYDANKQYLNLQKSKYLDDAKKFYTRIIQLIEEVVGSDMDRPLSDNRNYTVKIDRVNIRQILMISKKILYVFDTLVNKYGDNSKWKWSFVDLYARAANVIKNMINFNEIEKYRNFRSEFFQDREDLLHLCKTTLEEAAKELRNKYEISTKVPGDIQKAIALLSSLKMINSLYSESEEAERIKTVIDALRARVESEELKKEEEKKSRTPKK